MANMHGKGTEGVKTLLGDPKKALIKLSIPMIVAMSVTTLYNVVDALWVSGLGADALSAVGFFFPIFFIIMALAAGIGIGGGAAISRKIGSDDKDGADSVGIHTLVIMVIVAIVVSIPMFLLSEPLFDKMGAGRTLSMAVQYSHVIFAGSIFLFFSHVANAILRAEGDAKRAMYAMVLGAGINIILDPIFIYTLDLGVPGAAWATIISMAITSIFLFNWLFLKKDTFISFHFKGFRFNRSVIKEIFVVGIPASVMQLTMSISMVVTNLIAVRAGGTDGVAIFSTGWRVVMIGVLPLIGIATAIISITGAAYGAKDYQKLKTAYLYGVRLGAGFEVLIAVVIFFTAPWISLVFTQGEGGERIRDDLTFFIQITTLFYPAAAFGMFSSSMFQGTGKGTSALVVTLLRTVILAPPMSYILAFNFDMGLDGVWLGIVIANIIGAIISFSWATYYTNCLIKEDGCKKGESTT